MADEYLDLHKGQTLRLDTTGLERVGVGSGEIWLTQERDARDYILGPGSEMTPNGRGPAYIQARQPARLLLHAARTPKAITVSATSFIRTILAPLSPLQPKRG